MVQSTKIPPQHQISAIHNNSKWQVIMSKDVIVPTNACLAANDNQQPCFLMKNLSRMVLTPEEFKALAETANTIDSFFVSCMNN